MRSRANLVVLSLVAVSLVAAATGRAGRPQADTKQKAPAAKTDEAAEGEKRFITNCGRCHQPPSEISPREAKAVLRQMRVRAMLSAEDERLILKFLAP